MLALFPQLFNIRYAIEMAVIDKSLKLLNDNLDTYPVFIFGVCYYNNENKEMNSSDLEQTKHGRKSKLETQHSYRSSLQSAAGFDPNSIYDKIGVNTNYISEVTKKISDKIDIKQRNYSSSSQKQSTKDAVMERFQSHFYSIIWMTYRKGFHKLMPSGYVSDAGWGCMLRTAQMILAQAYQRHIFGIMFRINQDDLKNCYEHQRLLRWFADSSSEVALYSIHKMTRIGQLKFGKAQGQWYGPNTVSKILCDLVSQHNDLLKVLKSETKMIHTTILEKDLEDRFAVRPFSNYQLSKGTNSKFDISSSSDQIYKLRGLKIIVAESGDVYEGEVIEKCQADGSKLSSDASNSSKDSSNNMLDPLMRPVLNEEWEYALVILVTFKLGTQAKINPQYIPSLLHMLSFPQSIGFIGGAPEESYYFVGYQDQQLIYLDPHIVCDSWISEADDFEDYQIENNTSDTNLNYNYYLKNSKWKNLRVPNAEEMGTYHCKKPRLIDVSSIDPNVSIGFYCRNYQEYADLKGRVQLMHEKKMAGILYIREGKPKDHSLLDDSIDIDFDDFDEENEDLSPKEEDWVSLSRQTASEYPGAQSRSETPELLFHEE